MTPLTFTPYFRPQIWGGRRLGTMLGKPLPDEGRYGEAWELSSHSLHVSAVADGQFQGRSLKDLWSEFGTAWSPGSERNREFPLLVKWLDCDDLLSVQVHPDDAAARRLLNEERGKTEAWVVLHAEPNAEIYAGLKPEVDRAELERRMADGSVAECLHRFVPQRGDVVFIPAGTVHACGGGVLMAEVQQSSDATFRLFDWNRVGSDGRGRQLHIAQALECINWSQGPVNPVARISLDDPAASPRTKILECPYFRFESLALTPESLEIDNREASILMGLKGDSTMESRSSRIALAEGMTCFVPASNEACSIRAASRSGASVLRVEIPPAR